eukprot:3587981-Rhodomonas_salina.1
MAANCQTHPAQHTGRTEWPDKLSDALPHSTWARRNGQTNYQTPSSTAHRLDGMARQTDNRLPALLRDKLSDTI